MMVLPIGTASDGQTKVKQARSHAVGIVVVFGLTRIESPRLRGSHRTQTISWSSASGGAFHLLHLRTRNWADLSALRLSLQLRRLVPALAPSPSTKMHPLSSRKASSSEGEEKASRLAR